MISQEDQLNLFRLIARELNKDIVCYAFGGTAMMFYGYKNDTKDIDLLFEDEKSRQEFIKLIDKIGFVASSPVTVYIPEKLREKNKPLMFKRDDTRFDLFVGKIFRTKISPRMKEDLYAVHEFKEKHTLKIKVLKTEHIIQLKAITERKNDFDDIRTILKNDKNFDWQYLIDETIWQDQHGDTWAILDVEKTIKELKQYVFIEEKYLKQLYRSK